MSNTATNDPGVRPVIDPTRYRQVLGQYPTGVCAITARSSSGEPVAMIVGSFSSVSLAPPLIAFFPDRKSSSWAKLRECGRFCVNILSAEQEDVCRKLASKDPDKFTGVDHEISAAGIPMLTGAVGWIDCETHTVSDAGDHEMVTGLVIDLDVGSGDLPLLFFRGGYGRFSPASLVIDQGQGITPSQLRNVDCARSGMEELARRTGGTCIATLRVGDELVIAASAGAGQAGSATTLVGQRLPFTPPTGAVFAAWLPGADRQRWSAQARQQDVMQQSLERVAQRGFSIGLRTDAQAQLSERLLAAATGRRERPDIEDLVDGLAYDPVDLTPELSRDIRLISAPVFGADSHVELALTLYGFANPDAAGGINAFIEDVTGTAQAVTSRISHQL